MTKANAAGPASEAAGPEPVWKGLYRLGGVAALVAALVFRRWLGAELSLFQGLGVLGPDTTAAAGGVRNWFNLLHAHPLIGLISLNALDLVNYALVGLIFLGVYAALRNTARSLATLALILAWAGIALFFASNQGFALLALSRQYFAAADDAQKSLLLSAGQTLLALSDPMAFGSGVFWAFNFVTLSGLLLAAVMLRSGVFSRATGYLGLLANGLGLGYFLTVAFAPPLTFIPLSGSAPLLLIWYLLIGARLLQLARRA